MLDRASTFADPEIVKLLKSRFIPVAIDQAYQRRQKDAEGDFYRKIAGKGPRNDFVNGTTQGLYCASPDGTFLGFSNNRGSERILRLLTKALDDFSPGDVAAIERGEPDARYSPKPPDGGLVVRVHAKVLGGYPETGDPWKQIFQSAISRDNLWITADEHRALAEGRVPDALARRLARFHLVDNTRGEPPMWKDDEIRAIDLRIDGARVKGEVSLATRSGARSYRASLYGAIEVKEGRVTRFDLVAKGDFEGEGQFTRGAPKGTFPFAVSFTLADGTDTADAIPPQGSRGWVQGYLR